MAGNSELDQVVWGSGMKIGLDGDARQVTPGSCLGATAHLTCPPTPVPPVMCGATSLPTPNLGLLCETSHGRTELSVLERGNEVDGSPE